MKTKKNFLKKLTAGILGFVMTLGVGAAGYAASAGEAHAGDVYYKMTPDKTTTGNKSTSYVTTAYSFTSNEIGWSINQWNPSTLQIKTNQSSAGSEFNFKNTSAFPGAIKSVVITFSALSVSDASKLCFVGGTSAISSLSGGSAGTWNSTAKTLTWSPGSTTNYTYFAFYQNGKAASGTNYLASNNAIVVTYDQGSTPPTPTTFEVVYDDNAGGLADNMPSDYEGSDAYTIPTTTPTLDGYTFVEWNTEDDGTGDSYEAGDTITEDTILYAIWEEEAAPLEPGTYTVSISNTDFGSYDANWKVLSKTASEVDGTKTGQIDFYYKNVMNQSSKIQFKSGSGALYNDTNLGKINSVTLTSGSNLNIGYDIDENGDFEYTDVTEDDFPWFYITPSGTGTASTITINFTIKQEKTLDTISIKTNPKTTYNAGEKFDPTGLVITANYVETDVASEDIEYNDSTKGKFSFNPDLNTVLAKTVSSVKVIYGGKEANISITVNAAHSVTITGDNKVDTGDTITLSASCVEGDAISWSFADATSSQYASLTGNGATASVRGKREGTATIKAQCAHGEYATIIITISLKPSGYVLVEDASKLQDGDQIIIAAADSQGVYHAAGTFGSNKYMSSVDATVTNKVITSTDASIVTLKSVTGGWHLSNSEGYIKVNGTDISPDKSESNATTWTISISSNKASIAQSGSSTNIIYYNPSNPRFKTYTSTSQTKVEIYRLVCNDSIQYNSNGGTGGPVKDTNIYDVGETFVVKNNTFTRDNYTFAGWNTSKDGTGTPYVAGQSYPFTENLMLYAQWNGNQYNITYKDQNDTAFSGTHEAGYPTTHTYGTDTALLGASKTGYTFGGWFDNSGCTGSAKTSIGATEKTSNFTLYAKWTPVTAQIVYKNTDETTYTGQFDGTKVTQYTYGTAVNLSPAKKAGFTFNGFYSNKECTGSPITSIGAIEHSSSESIVLYVSFTVHTWNITYYDKTSGDAKAAYSGNNEASLPKTFDYDKGVTLDPGTKDHYTFGGWYTSNASTSAITSIAANTSANDHDYDLYARWIADEYTISYKYKNANDEWVDYNGYGVARTHTYGTATPLTSPTGLSGYSFNGFYDNQSLSGDPISTISATTALEQGYTLYMDTEVSDFTLHYNNVVEGDLPLDMPTVHSYGTATTLPAAYDKSDGTYAFKGWYYNDACTNRVPGTLGSQAIPADKAGSAGVLELYALWEGVKYNISYHDKDGAAFSGVHGADYATKHTYGTATTLDTPTKTGYDFGGYYLDSACASTAITSIPANRSVGDIDIYASWTVQTYTITYVGAETSYTLATGSPTTHTYDSDTTLLDPSRPGYRFDGWYLNGSFSGDSVSVLGAKDYTANITLYPKWTFNAYDDLNAVNTTFGMSFKYTKDGVPTDSTPVNTTKAETKGTNDVSTYSKVTDTSDIVAGKKYLIVYETGSVALNGNLTADSANNTVSVTISNGKITGSTTIDQAAVTIGANGSILGSGGKYIGHTGTSNTLNYSDTAYTNTISISSGNVSFTNGDYTMKYNNANDQKRFRYYKSGQQAIQLYKLDEVAELDHIVIEGTPSTTSYTVGQAYSTSGLHIEAYYDDNSHKAVSGTITIDKSTAAMGDTSITYSATYEGKTDTKDVNVTVNHSYSDVQFKLTIKTDGMDQLLAEYRDAFEDIGICVQYNGKTRYFSFVQADDDKYYMYEGKTQTAYKLTNGSFGLNIGDAINERDRASIEFTITVYVKDENGYHYSEVSNTTTLLSWFEDHNKSSYQTDQFLELYSIFFPSEN